VCVCVKVCVYVCACVDPCLFECMHALCRYKCLHVCVCARMTRVHNSSVHVPGSSAYTHAWPYMHTPRSSTHRPGGQQRTSSSPGAVHTHTPCGSTHLHVHQLHTYTAAAYRHAWRRHPSLAAEHILEGPLQEPPPHQVHAQRALWMSSSIKQSFGRAARMHAYASKAAWHPMQAAWHPMQAAWHPMHACMHMPAKLPGTPCKLPGTPCKLPGTSCMHACICQQSCLAPHLFPRQLVPPTHTTQPFPTHTRQPPQTTTHHSPSQLYNTQYSLSQHT